MLVRKSLFLDKISVDKVEIRFVFQTQSFKHISIATSLGLLDHITPNIFLIADLYKMQSNCTYPDDVGSEAKNLT